MAEPWKCPDCGTWMAPGVTQHRCDGTRGSAGATVTPITPGGAGGGSVFGTVTWTGRAADVALMRASGISQAI